MNCGWVVHWALWRTGIRLMVMMMTREIPTSTRFFNLIYIFFPGDDVRLLPNKFALSIFPCADHRRLSSPSLDRRALVSFPCMLQSL